MVYNWPGIRNGFSRVAIGWEPIEAGNHFNITNNQGGQCTNLPALYRFSECTFLASVNTFYGPWCFDPISLVVIRLANRLGYANRRKLGKIGGDLQRLPRLRKQRREAFGILVDTFAGFLPWNAN